MPKLSVKGLLRGHKSKESNALPLKRFVVSVGDRRKLQDQPPEVSLQVSSDGEVIDVESSSTYALGVSE
jgi:hypothetical protein